MRRCGAALCGVLAIGGLAALAGGAATEEPGTIPFFRILEVPLPGDAAASFDFEPGAEGWHVVWASGTTLRISYAFLDASGRAWKWSIPGWPTDGADAPLGEHVRLDANGAVLVATWQAAGASHQDLDIVYATLDLGSREWTEPVTLHDDDGRQALPRPACSPSRCALVWQEESASSADDWRIVGAQVWPSRGPKVQLSAASPDTKMEFPAVAAAGEVALVAWTERRPDSGGLWTARWPLDGGTPSEPRAVATAEPNRSRTAASLAVGHGVLLSWVELELPVSRRVSVATSRDSGSAWDGAAAAELSVDASDPRHTFAFHWGDGSIGVGWEDVRWGLPELVVARLADGSAAWEVHRLSPAAPRAQQGALDAEARDGHTYFFFREVQGAESRILLATDDEVLAIGSSEPVSGLPVGWLVPIGATALVALVRRRESSRH